MINTSITTMKIEVNEKDMKQVVSDLSKDGWKYIGPDESLEKKVAIVFYKMIYPKL